MKALTFVLFIAATIFSAATAVNATTLETIEKVREILANVPVEEPVEFQHGSKSYWVFIVGEARVGVDVLSQDGYTYKILPINGGKDFFGFLTKDGAGHPAVEVELQFDEALEAFVASRAKGDRVR